MPPKLLDEEQLLLGLGNDAKSEKMNVTYHLSREVVETFNRMVPDRKRGAMIEVLMKQFIQRHEAAPISRAPKLVSHGGRDED